MSTRRIMSLNNTLGMVFVFLGTFLVGNILASGALVNKVSAVTYQQEVPVEFTFNPTLSINLSSSSILVNNLAPGSAADSNVVTVSVTTNAANGYILSATAGIKGGDTNLTNTSDNTYKFTNLATTAGSASTLNNIPENYWGYTYSTDNGSTWVSGSVGSTAAGYAGLPLDNNDNAEERGKGGTTLISTENPADSKNVKFKIGAKASTSQPAGTYTNVINFYAVANVGPKDISNASTMQEVNTCPNTLPTGTAYTLTDARDGEQYKVARLADGNCWLLDNLRLDPTSVSLANLQGNTNASDTTLNYLKNGGGTSPYTSVGVNAAWSGSAGDKYNEPKVNFSNRNITVTNYGSGSGKVGLYYNFCAASAGSYCYANASTGDASEDLCPSGWRMPTSTPAAGDYYNLYVAYSSSDTALREALSLLLSGRFNYGSAKEQNVRGKFWASNRVSDYGMYSLEVVESSLLPTTSTSRTYGISIRCIFNK